MDDEIPDLIRNEAFIPDVIYHYTDGAALSNILETRQLWASEPLYLNDAQELLAGRDRLKQVIEAPKSLTKSGQSDSDQLLKIWNGVAGPMSRSAHELVDTVDTFVQGAPHVFVTCFCDAGDLLSQWRSYGHGGYAIGFDRFAMEADITLDGLSIGDSSETRGWLPPNLVRVAYRQGDIDRLLEDVDLFKPSGEAGWIPDGQPSWRILEALASIKDDGFEEEREWRLLFVRSAGLKAPRVKFRMGAGSLVPYIELTFPIRAVKEIVVGPGGNAPLRIMAIRRLLEVQEIEAEVRSSSVPYRAASG